MYVASSVSEYTFPFCSLGCIGLVSDMICDRLVRIVGNVGLFSGMRCVSLVQCVRRLYWFSS